ncbi:MAG: hypothetical protein HOE90_20830 [Bacteriovoracaceae bacterium]|jgi:uncharacterized protein YjiK|nr:hypothetical protein [Bacteriovoracaceae bacterium]
MKLLNKFRPRNTYLGLLLLATSIISTDLKAQEQLKNFDFFSDYGIKDDLSGMVYIPQSASYLLILNGRDRYFEVDENFELIRDIKVSGNRDTEDAFMLEGGSSAEPQLAIVEEGGLLRVGALDSEMNLRSFQTVRFKRYIGNKGAEGATFNPNNGKFYGIKEKKPLDIYSFEWDQTSKKKATRSRSILNPTTRAVLEGMVEDLSSIVYDDKHNRLLILSDDSKKLIAFDLDTSELSEVASFEQMDQPEGITIGPDGKIIITGEPNEYLVLDTK